MKPRVTELFLRLYWMHRPESRAKIHEITGLLLTLFKHQNHDKNAGVTFRSCVSTLRGTFVAFTFDEIMKDELIEVTQEDRQMIIDEVLRLTTDDEIVRIFRKKKLELELKI